MQTDTPDTHARIATLPPATWFAARAALEQRFDRRRLDNRRRLRINKWHIAHSLFHVSLRLAGLYGRGARNARDLRIKEMEIAFDALPAPFDGYRILHMTDLHFDRRHNPGDHLIDHIAGLKVDLCALTGDYRYRRFGPIDDVVEAMTRLRPAISARDGVFATLGNHDSASMVEPFAAVGIRVLGNETLSLTRGGAHFHITGIDDVHYYYTRDADRAMAAAPDGFRMALVHSPEFAPHAARAGVALYLAGHTHGGQVCLPGARPVITNLYSSRQLATGLWQLGDMVGYTSPGVGASVVPVRFNCPPEITVITLRRAKPDEARDI